MKIFKNYRFYLILFILIVFVAALIITTQSFLYNNDVSSLYGNRLDGVENVKISEQKTSTIIEKVTDYDEVKSVSIDINGRIINVVIREKEDLKVELAKELPSIVLNEFTDLELEFYDFQFFVVSENYSLIGYKNSTAEEVVWSQVSEVDEDEE